MAPALRWQVLGPGIIISTGSSIEITDIAILEILVLEQQEV